MSLTWNSNSVTSLSGRMHWELTAIWLKLLLSQLLLAVSAILNVWLSEMAPKQNDDVLVTSLPRATIKDRLRMTHKPQTLTCLEKWPIVCRPGVQADQFVERCVESLHLPWSSPLFCLLLTAPTISDIFRLLYYFHGPRPVVWEKWHAHVGNSKFLLPFAFEKKLTSEFPPGYQ